ncbi:MAG TPA: branched-chain amino acid ABC transporter permease [Smithellaceae bacterium]|nr:branched-chain amino acid ABC transporter permease [Smithellaceae bacterium]
MINELTPVQQDRLNEQKTRYTNKGFWLQLIFIACLILVPIVIPSFRVVDMVAKIMIMIVLVASYDLILGYTGILSFAHHMFWGIGAYSVALLFYHSTNPSAYLLIAAIIIAVALSFVLSLLLTMFSLRVQAIFFALLSLAVAEFALILSEQWTSLTMGEDGVNFPLPDLLSSASASGRMVTYYLILVISLFLFFLLMRFVQSPLGKVLRAIKDNEKRATAMGYKTLRYKIVPIVVGSCIAAISGILFALWLRFVDPKTVFSSGVMIFVLLMVIIGGLGTMWGSICGVVIIYLAQTWLPDLLKVGASLLPPHPIITGLAERWMLYFGIMFILIMLFFPRGVVGTIQKYLHEKKVAQLKK